MNLPGAVFVNGYTLDSTALMPNEYEPEVYSNAAVNLPENPTA